MCFAGSVGGGAVGFGCVGFGCVGFGGSVSAGAVVSVVGGVVGVGASGVLEVSFPPPQAHRDRHSTSARSRKNAFFIQGNLLS